MKVLAPLSGTLVDLTTIPDEMFASKTVGDGVSIDPTDSVLLSPLDAIVEFIHPSHHALSLRTDFGPALLIHIGIDTVSLRSEGFKCFVKAGDRVVAGAKLIEFDVDYVAQKSKSLLTQILLSEPAGYSVKKTSADKASASKVVTAGKTEVFEIIKVIEASTIEDSNLKIELASNKLVRKFICTASSGMHARPAAELAQLAKSLNVEIAVEKSGRKVNAKSLVSVLGLAIAQNEGFSIEITGSAAQLAMERVADFLSQHLASPESQQEIPKTIKGICAASGVAFGKTLLFEVSEISADEVVQYDIENETKTKSEIRFDIDKALLGAQTQIENILARLKGSDSEEQTTIFKAHLEILNDPEIRLQVDEKIDLGSGAATSWKKTLTDFQSILKAQSNELIAARAHDLEDVEQRVLRCLLQRSEVDVSDNFNSATDVVVIAKQLTPSDIVRLKHPSVKGLVTVEGGATSHVAIMARSMGLAYLTAANAAVLKIANGTEVYLDAENAILEQNPDRTKQSEVKNIIEKLSQQRAEDLKHAFEPALTKDGHRFLVYANVGNAKETQEAATQGAEGVGLLRSEFLFLHRTSAPSEVEQENKYFEVLAGLGKRNEKSNVIIRTLDVGGDKPLPYLPVEPEENPFLGIRGLRLSLRSPDLFRQQLRALLKAQLKAEAQGLTSKLEIMFPMVTTLSELLEAKEILAHEQKAIGIEKVATGIMIEVPSAALMSDILAPHVDFFSVGSNDLTQYTLAIDRGHKDLAEMADGLHPSVLRLIDFTCKSAQKHKKLVGVCGGIASDALAVPILVGLGVQELSVSVPTIPSIKAQIRNLTYQDCVKMAQLSLTLSSGDEVRKLVREFLIK